MKRKRMTLIALGVALLLAILPFLFQWSPRLFVLSNPTLFFLSAVFIFIAASLQFPFEEEEGWRCQCDYDLSFLPPKSKHCPECGSEIKLEWTTSPGIPSKKTRMRGLLTALLTVFGSGCILFGLFIGWLEEMASV
ncbi:MAG: hypothetical protein MK073_07350 [Phycisphaerales bacterium]|nr:hypothetical protein [Phycisphaerales bacterium]